MCMTVYIKGNVENKRLHPVYSKYQTAIQVNLLIFPKDGHEKLKHSSNVKAYQLPTIESHQKIYVNIKTICIQSLKSVVHICLKNFRRKFFKVFNQVWVCAANLKYNFKIFFIQFRDCHSRLYVVCENSVFISI